MKTLNLPLDFLCRKFTVQGVTKEELAAALARFSEGLQAGSIELDLAGRNQLQVFCEDPELHKWLANEGYIARALVIHLFHCNDNMLHGPGCDCSILPPSKRQGQIKTMQGARA